MVMVNCVSVIDANPDPSVYLQKTSFGILTKYDNSDITKMVHVNGYDI